MKKSVVKWLYMDEDKPHYDLCGKTKNGLYCDVVNSSRNGGCWSVSVDNKHIDDVETKEEGRKLCEKYVAEQIGKWS